MKMPGWVLADPDVIRKIDTAAKFIKVSLKADGTIYQSSRSQVKSGEDSQADGCMRWYFATYGPADFKR